MALSPEETKRLVRLRGLVSKTRTGGPRSLSDEELEEFSDLYRFACTRLARQQSRGENEELLTRLHHLASDAHGVLFRGLVRAGGSLASRAVDLFLHRSPRAIRAEWKLYVGSFVLFYGLAAAAFFAVSRDLSLAYALFDPATVQNEISQLESTPPGEPFRGNFTFGLGESPQAATWIMLHNMGVGVLFFATALVPVLYAWILVQNSLMVGTYTGVAAHWDQAGSISSILWCHGVIELQTFLLAATGGLVLVRAALRPGARTRRYAIQVEAERAWELLAPVFPLLFVAGLIEGFISPHAPATVRLVVAVTTGVALLLWALLGGRGDATSAGAARVQPGGQ